MQFHLKWNLSKGKLVLLVLFIYYAVLNTVTFWLCAQTIHTGCANAAREPKNNRHQMPGSGRPQWQGWWICPVPGTTVLYHHRSSALSWVAYLLQVISAAAKQLPCLFHIVKTLKITRVMLIPCLRSWWTVLKPSFSSNRYKLVCPNSGSSY